MKLCRGDPLSEVLPAFVKPVDLENVEVGQAVSLPDGNRGVRERSYGFRSILSKGSSTDLERN